VTQGLSTNHPTTSFGALRLLRVNTSPLSSCSRVPECASSKKFPSSLSALPPRSPLAWGRLFFSFSPRLVHKERPSKTLSDPPFLRIPLRDFRPKFSVTPPSFPLCPFSLKRSVGLREFLLVVPCAPEPRALVWQAFLLSVSHSLPLSPLLTSF